MKKLRDYQSTAVDKILAAHERGMYSGIVHFATGLGKTVTAFSANFRINPPEKGRTIFIAPSRSLIVQTAQSYIEDYPELQGTYHTNGYAVKGIGVVMGSTNQSDARIIVGSAQTLVDKNVEDYETIKSIDIQVSKWGGVLLNPASSRRVLVSERMDDVLKYGIPDLVIFDECHHAVADGSLVLLRRLKELRSVIGLPPLKIIGFTATPIRQDGRGLMNIFEHIHDRKDYLWGQRHGYLVPFADPVRVVIQGLNNQDVLANTFNWEAQVVDTYREVCKDRSAIAFTGKVGELSGVEVSKRLAEAFRAAGISSAHIDASTTIDETGKVSGVDARGDVFDKCRKGQIKVLCSFGVGIEGLDIPRLSALLWLRQTDNAPMRTQAIGRILRPHETKSDALIVDFTDKRIEVDPIGSLVGFKVDPLTKQYVKEVLEDSENEEDETSNNVPKLSGTTIAQGRVYKTAQIIAKQNSDWYEDSDTEVLSLGINESEVLFITPPNYHYANRLGILLRDIDLAMMGEPNPYSALNENHRVWWEKFSTMPAEDAKKHKELLTWAKGFYNNYNMWHVIGSSLKVKAPILQDVELGSLLGAASEYMHNLNVIEKFAGKRQSWKSSSNASVKQLEFLARLGYKGEGRLAMGEAAKLITFYKVRPIVNKIIGGVEKSILVYMDS